VLALEPGLDQRRSGLFVGKDHQNPETQRAGQHGGGEFETPEVEIAFRRKNNKQYNTIRHMMTGFEIRHIINQYIDIVSAHPSY